jgi:hypothetical protein
MDFSHEKGVILLSEEKEEDHKEVHQKMASGRFQ